MNSPLVLRDLFGEFAPEKYGDFVPLHPGVEILPLYGIASDGRHDSPSTPSAAFLRYAPGAHVPRHEHMGFEHIIVLSGSQSDARGNYSQGTCVVNPPGSNHAVISEEGCLVLAIWVRPVELMKPSEGHD